MNVSNPLLYTRWFARKKTGRADNRLYVAFAVVFALCRFGMIKSVLQRYEEYPGLSAWYAYKRLRVLCKTGTAALVGPVDREDCRKGFGKRQKI